VLVNKKVDSTDVIDLKNEKKAEYVENYIDFVYDKNGYPALIQTVDEVESEVFIKQIKDYEMDPKNMLQVGNEIYFVTETNKIEDRKGTVLFLYDVIMRKFRELYFYKKEENNTNIEFVLKAIDIKGNKLVIILQDEDLDCGSLWLEQKDNFYTLDLLDNGKNGLIKYGIPEWKIEEEKEINFGCE